MLDDLKYLNKVDKGDALGVAGKQADQLLHDFAASFQSKADIFNIVVGGMGGSGWPSLVLRSWPGLTVPFELSSNYHVPSYVNKSTLYIASSYSGNTEETIEALGEAAERGATIVVMAAGLLFSCAGSQKPGLPEHFDYKQFRDSILRPENLKPADTSNLFDNAAACPDSFGQPEGIARHCCLVKW